ncbi:MAG: HdaA/DnaA family protein [Sphingosinicella sp.]
MSQNVLPFAWPVADREEDFLITDCNRQAYDHLRRWALWPVMATVLTGPRKSGRSLLGRIFIRKTGGRLFDPADRHEEEELFHAWNEAQIARKPVLFIAGQSPAEWDVALPDLKSRLAATPYVAITDPDDNLIGQLIVKQLGDRGIAAPPELAAFVAPRIERTYVAALAAVDILDRAILTHQKRMTVPLARRALEEAGLLHGADADPVRQESD